ncbi:MAG TPA: DUF6285 domain-containing protein, partial [Solirubrobacteraceae bacterium]|nr:DUF6285 domain-containing protein [Solirubrobacteraceae bacterium]
RWGVICVMQAFSHLSGARRSLEHAVIGRRACEVEWDLLEMLDPREQAPSARARGQYAPPAVGLHDRPSAVELLEAARGGLGEHALPALAGRAQFEVRVALRALGMVARELALVGEHEPARQRALAGLGVADEAGLAAAIRAGELAGREHEVHGALRELVRAKLEVANPRYLEGAGTRT